MNNMPGYEAAQRAWENMTPPEDNGCEDYITDQAAMILDVDDSGVLTYESFEEVAGEMMADHYSEVIQLVLAVYRNRTELAQKIGCRLGELLKDKAEAMVTAGLEK